MIASLELLASLRPLHICIGKTGHITQSGRSIAKLGAGNLVGQRFLEVFEVQRPTRPSDMTALRQLSDQVIRLRFRAEPDLALRALVLDDRSGGLILDISFGIAVVSAVRRFGLTAKDFAASDLAVELLFLQEAKSTAMAASFNLNTRLNGARLAAETEALTDGLTGLHNRRALDGALMRLGQSETDFAVLHMDLDRFKAVNDTLGHATGDTVLKQVADVMRAQTRQNDLLVRMGGNEFVIICPGLTDHLRLAGLSDALISGVSDPTLTEQQGPQIGASIGIAISASGLEPATIIDRADIALYAAKRAGRGCHRVWTPDMGTSLSELDA